MTSFYVLTLFPDFFDTFANTSIIKKGIEKEKYNIIIKNIRDNAINRYGQVDDIPYGGGGGMLLRPEPIFESYYDLGLDKKEKKKIIFFSPKGKKIDHNYIIDLTKYENIGLICGHYEGIDQRVIDTLVDEEVSIGDFVLTGGELPAMTLIDAVARQLDGVITRESLEEESFSNGLLEYKHYTRPVEYKGMKVPDILLSGHHKNIEQYRLEESVKETLLKRPDLLKDNNNKEIVDIINKLKGE